MVNPRVLGGSCLSLSGAPWFTPGFGGVRVDHFREHHGSPPGFGGVRVDHFREHHG